MTTSPPLGNIQQAYNNALRLLSENKPHSAEEQSREILSRFPDDVDAMRVLGLSLAAQGKFAEAEKQLKETIQKTPDFAAAHDDLGRVYMETGNLRQAERSLKRAVELAPDLIDAWKRLGDALSARGRKQEAEEAYGHVIAANPLLQMMKEAKRLMAREQYGEAEKLYKKILHKDPGNTEAFVDLALIAFKSDHSRESELLLHHARNLDENNFRGWALYGHVLMARLKLEDSEEVLRAGLEKYPDNSELWTSLGETLGQLLRAEEAVAAYEKALQIKPDQPRVMLAKGNLLNQVGDIAASASHFKQALKHQESKGEAYWCLSNLKTYTFSDAEITDMERSLTELDEESNDVAHLNFALAKVAEDREEYDTAFRYYAAGNAHRKGVTEYDPGIIEQGTDRIIRLFTPEFFEERRDYGHDDPAPVFILGMPRSGSTLVEQILSSHSQIDGTMELAHMNQLLMDLIRGEGDGQKTPYPEIVNDLTAQDCKAMGEKFIEDTKQYRGDAPRFIDKTPHNFLDIGLIHLILPNATIVDARRHPMGACFGCYKQYFPPDRSFTHDLDDLGRYFVNYSRLMDHWNIALPGKVHRVQYEDLVQDAENQVRQALEHCGLAFEKACLRFHETERNIRTHSAQQVRQPIYTEGVDFWRNYEKHLDPLKQALAPVLDNYPGSNP